MLGKTDEFVPWEVEHQCNLMNAIFSQTVNVRVWKLLKETRWSKLLKNLPRVRAHICSSANSIMHCFMLVEYNILHSE